MNVILNCLQTKQECEICKIYQVDIFYQPDSIYDNYNNLYYYFYHNSEDEEEEYEEYEEY
jgi:hypothetical protein